MFSYPFMQRAFISGAVIAVLLASLGTFVTLRRMTFFGDGIAHSSLAEIAIAILAGVAPLPMALLWALFIALLIYWLEHTTRLPSDTLIGIFFTASLALGVILMSYSTGYQPELLSFLFGSILAIKTADILFITFVTAAIMLWLTFSFRQLTYLSLAEDSAIVSGIPAKLQNIIFYIALAFATVLGVKILGIILISALLVLPSATSRMLTWSFRNYILVAILVAEIDIFAGLSLSFLYDLPSGATIILFATAIFFLSALLRKRRVA